MPTILDNISTQAALNTLRVIAEFREHLNPTLDVLGVVPTMVANQNKLNTREQDSLDRLLARMREYWKKPPFPHVFQQNYICRREAIAKAAGAELAYNSSDEVKQMVASLGDAIAERVFNHGDEGPGQPTEALGNVTTLADAKRRA